MSQPTQPLQQKLAATRRFWRVTRLLIGLAWLACVVIALGLLCFHFDRVLKLAPAPREHWRTGIGIAGLATLLLMGLRPLLRRLPDRVLAAEVERKYPSLAERLLTTIDLVPAYATATGKGSLESAGFSPALTHALAEETHRAAADLDFRRAVNLTPLKRAGLALAFVALLLGLHVAFAPDAFAIWLRRMADPRADIAPWAQTRVWITPDATLLPRGAGVSVTVLTRGVAANKATLRYRPANDKTGAWKTVELANATDMPATTTDPDGTNRTALTGNRPNFVRKFRYHFPTLTQSTSLEATANDGSSNERDVTVEDRPTLTNVRLVLHYPAYTHRGTQILPESTGSIAALTGTDVEVQATANKPLKSAEFVRDHVEAGAWRVEGDRAFGQIGVRKNGTYSLKLTDRHDFDNPHLPDYQIQALKDQAPTVQISRPTAVDVDLVPNGSLPLVAHASDDFGVARMKLDYTIERGDPMNSGTKVGIVSKGALDLPGPTGAAQADVSQRWNIASVRPQPGQTVRYEIEAIDNDTVSGPNTGRSAIYRVHVVSVLEMQHRLKTAMEEEARAVAQLRQHQIEAQKQLQQARGKLDKSALSRAQEMQRITQQEAQSLAQRVGETNTQMENNNFGSKSEMQRRQDAQKTLESGAAQKMNAAANAMQQAQDGKASEKASQANQADKQQSAARKDVERAQQLLSRTPPPDQLTAEAARLAQEQRQLADQSRSLAEDIHAQQQAGNKSLTGAQKASLQTQRQQQAQTSADTAKLQKQLQQAAHDAKEQGDSKTAEAMQKAADALKQANTSGQQAQAQKSLNQSQPQSAAAPQERAANALQKAAQAAQQANPDAVETPQAAAERLEQAAQKLEALARQQREIAKQTAQNPDSAQSKALAQQEKNIAQQAQDQKLNLSGAQQAQQSVQQAQQNLNQSQQQLGQGSPQNAKPSAQQAAQNLEKAAQQAAQAAQQMKQAQAAQELADRVERLAQVQRGLQSATQRLQKARDASGLTPNDAQELAQVAARQERIEEEARDLAERFPSPAFQQALRMASRQMHPASENLNSQRHDTGTPTQDAQNRAAQTLETITQALKQQASGDSQPAPNQPPGQQSGGSPQQQQQNAALGELMLAQGLQKQLRKDTGTLDSARKSNPNQSLNNPQQAQAQQLTGEQRDTQQIAEHAAQQLSDMPKVAQAVREATGHMQQAEKGLSQQQTGQPTQTHQDEASKGLAQAAKQAQEAMQQQQQQAQAQQQGQQGAPQQSSQPGQQPGKNNNQRPFSKMKAQGGTLSAPDQRSGQFGGLNARTQRVLREGQSEHVPAEYQEPVSRYYKSLAEKKR